MSRSPLVPLDRPAGRAVARALLAAAVVASGVALGVVAPARLDAQDSLVARPAPDAARASWPGVGRSNVLSVQPLHAVFGAYSAEYERFVGALVSLAGSATYTDGEILDWDDYNEEEATVTTDVKLRFYPEARSFHGLSVGLQAGALREREYVVAGDPPSFNGDWEQRWSPTVGVLLERGWLDRRTGRMLVATGIGAKRVLRRGDYRADESYLTLRLAIGLAF
jgi:hypothetical protein